MLQLNKTTQKGVMNFTDRLHKRLLDDIIHRGEIDFNKHDKHGPHYVRLKQ